MTHTYLATNVESIDEQRTIRELLMTHPKIADVHFPENSRHISVTMRSYITINDINVLFSKINSFKLIKQIDMSPIFDERHETTGKMSKWLALILNILFIITLVYGSYVGLHELNTYLRIYVGGMLCLFGILKVMKLMDFAESHQRYDIISKHFFIYAYVYPFLEIYLGLCIIFNYHIVVTYILLIFILTLRLTSVVYSIGFNKKVHPAYFDGTLKIRISSITAIMNFLIILFALSQLGLLLQGLI